MHDSGRCRNPDVGIAIARERQNRTARKCRGDAAPRYGASVPMHQAGICSNPQLRTGCRQQRIYLLVRQAGHLRCVPASYADQSVIAESDPHGVIGGFRDRHREPAGANPKKPAA